MRPHDDLLAPDLDRPTSKSFKSSSGACPLVPGRISKPISKVTNVEASWVRISRLPWSLMVFVPVLYAIFFRVPSSDPTPG